MPATGDRKPARGSHANQADPTRHRPKAARPSRKPAASGKRARTRPQTPRSGFVQLRSNAARFGTPTPGGRRTMQTPPTTGDRTAGTYLVHLFGGGLVDERYDVQRFESRADGEIRAVSPDRNANGGRRTVSLRAVRRLMPKPTEIVIATGVDTGGGQQVWGDTAAGSICAASGADGRRGRGRSSGALRPASHPTRHINATEVFMPARIESARGPGPGGDIARGAPPATAPDAVHGSPSRAPPTATNAAPEETPASGVCGHSAGQAGFAVPAEARHRTMRRAATTAWPCRGADLHPATSAIRLAIRLAAAFTGSFAKCA